MQTIQSRLTRTVGLDYFLELELKLPEEGKTMVVPTVLAVRASLAARSSVCYCSSLRRLAVPSPTAPPPSPGADRHRISINGQL